MRLPRFQGLGRRLTYANVMATLALFFALTGGAMAGVKYLQASDAVTQGDLAGSTYGNPVVAASKITTGKIADGAITTAKFDSSAKAPNADKLDGLDSTAFLSGYEIVSNRKQYSGPGGGSFAGDVLCPTGKVAVGGGANGDWSEVGGFPFHNIQLDRSIPFAGATVNGWEVAVNKDNGDENLATGETITITTYAVCATTTN